MKGLNEKDYALRGKDSGKDYIPTREEQIEFRSLVVRSVNHLEAALIPLYSNIADRDIISEQLRPYFTDELGRRLDPLRRQFGPSMLPNTIRMMNEIAQAADPGTGKPPLDPV
jgi:hypothetical protein